MTKEQQTLIQLLHYGLHEEGEVNIYNEVNWPVVLSLSQKHGVAAIAFDGMALLKQSVDVEINQNTKLKWIGWMTQQEQCYLNQANTIESLARFYTKFNIRMMVLKGWGLSLDYPIRSHRTCNDIDIFLFGEQKRGDNLLNQELGIKIDNSEHQHSIFVYQGETVENHYDFLNVYAHLSSQKIEKRLKELATKAVP